MVPITKDGSCKLEEMPPVEMHVFLADYVVYDETVEHDARTSYSVAPSFPEEVVKSIMTCAYELIISKDIVECVVQRKPNKRVLAANPLSESDIIGSCLLQLQSIEGW